MDAQATVASAISKDDTPRGFAYALAAYFMWGFLPAYIKLLGHVAPLEIIAHRTLWSVPVAAILLVAMRRTADIRVALKSPRILLFALLTATLIALNWGTYVWAIANERVLDAALGYYVNPLFSTLLAVVFLGEKLDRYRIVAIALAVCAVVILTVFAGGLPWVSMVLVVTWGFYAMFKRVLPIGPAQGFLLEVLLLSVPALGYIVWLAINGTGHFGPTGASDILLLVGSGAATAIPLITYANAAKLLSLSTIGIMQYIAPTMIFLTAVFWFGEPFSVVQLIAFMFIWSALAVYSWPVVARRLARSRSAPAS